MQPVWVGNHFGVVDVLGTAIGIAHLAVAVVVARQIRGSAQLFPWLAVLATFFAVRGVDRITESLAQARPPVLSPLTDALVLVALVLLLVGLERTVTGLRAAYEEADMLQEQYARALTDYATLTRHRLANPLAALRGGIVTLREVDTLSGAERELLLEMLERETIRLERISLDPRRLSAEERRLRPLPGESETRSTTTNAAA